MQKKTHISTCIPPSCLAAPLWVKCFENEITRSETIAEILFGVECWLGLAYLLEHVRPTTIAVPLYSLVPCSYVSLLTPHLGTRCYPLPDPQAKSRKLSWESARLLFKVDDPWGGRMGGSGLISPASPAESSLSGERIFFMLGIVQALPYTGLESQPVEAAGKVPVSILISSPTLHVIHLLDSSGLDCGFGVQPGWKSSPSWSVCLRGRSLCLRVNSGPSPRPSFWSKVRNIKDEGH